MFVEQMRRAIAAAPRERLAELSAAVWKAFGAGAVSEDDAQALAEAVEAKKAVRATPTGPRRVGSRPRSSESMERRRRWVASGLMPPQIAARFTMGEGAVLAVLAAECSKRGRCTLTIGHIAALAGVCKTTVRNAVRQATALGLLKSDEWRLSAFRSAPNTVTITSPEWQAWLKLGQRSVKGRAHVVATRERAVGAYIAPGHLLGSRGRSARNDALALGQAEEKASCRTGSFTAADARMSYRLGVEGVGAKQ